MTIQDRAYEWWLELMIKNERRFLNMRACQLAIRDMKLRKSCVDIASRK